MQSLQSCTPLIPGIRKAREARRHCPLILVFSVWDWLPRAPKLEGSGSPLRIVSHLFPRQPWAGRNPWHSPSASRCPPSLNANISKLLSAPRKSAFLSLQAATAEKWQCQTSPLPDQPQRWFLQDIAVKILQVFSQKIKGILLIFKYSIRKAEAHVLCAGSCPMCPNCCHTSTKRPILEELFQPWRGLLWKKLQESLWLLLYAN